MDDDGNDDGTDNADSALNHDNDDNDDDDDGRKTQHLCRGEEKGKERRNKKKKKIKSVLSLVSCIFAHVPSSLLSFIGNSELLLNSTAMITTKNVLFSLRWKAASSWQSWLLLLLLARLTHLFDGEISIFTLAPRRLSLRGLLPFCISAINNESVFSKQTSSTGGR